MLKNVAEQVERLVDAAGPQCVRNVCVVAHVDHGKTTLCDQLIASNGLISSRLAGKLRFLDSMPEEQARGITMRASAVSLHYRSARKARGAAAEGTGGDDSSAEHVVNLIDSPGHIDFSYDVATATRLCDGAIVVIDVVEGVCIQTNTALRQAWAERMRPTLVLNKIDRLIGELKLSPTEAWERIKRVLESVNALVSALINSEGLATPDRVERADVLDDGDGDAAAADEQQEALEDKWHFRPEVGNVVFASASGGWGFGIARFAGLWAAKIGANRRLLRRTLWGEWAYHARDKKVVRYVAGGKLKPMFVSMILEPIWQLHEIAFVGGDIERAVKMAGKLGVEFSPRELPTSDSVAAATAIFRRWLPLSDAVLQMVVDIVPPPHLAQPQRVAALWPPRDESSAAACDAGEARLVRDATASCDRRPGAPLVAFISKMLRVSKAELPPSCHRLCVNDEGGEPSAVIAFARVFSGVLATGEGATQLHVLGPRYDPSDPDSRKAHAHTLDGSQLELFLMMGNGLHGPVRRVQAGQVIAISGLANYVNKFATLTTTLACTPMQAVTLPQRPMIRVAVEATHAVESDMVALERGLVRLHQADPAVEVSTNVRGEHVVAAVGELHLEQCLKDLRERYAAVELRSSAPLISLREGVAAYAGGTAALDTSSAGSRKRLQTVTPPWCDEEGLSSADDGAAIVATPDNRCVVAVRCVPLPWAAAKLIDEHPERVRVFCKLRSTLEGEGSEGRSPNGDATPPMEEARREAILFRDSLLAALSEGGPQFSEDRGAFLKRVVAFGPRGVGSNVLVRHSRMSVSVNGETPSSSTDESAAMPTDFDGDLWRQVEGAIAAGFQLASAAGPLAEEPMHGICFLVESVKIQQGSGVVVTRDEEPELPTPLTTTGEEPTPAPPEPPAPTAAQTTIASGPLIASVKVACRAAFLTANVRVVEAYYRCELQCAQKHLGSLYGLLAKRRGRVVDEDVIEGTDLFLISALLPVVESFGFGAEMLEWTSGAATAPQLSFAHWELMDFDPFWQPLTADEREDISYGEASLTRTENVARRCIRRIRERKGLAVERRIVADAQKQRNLSRKK